MTPRQEEYLLLFATLEGRSKCVTDAAEYFNVRKSTVSILTDELARQGLLVKTRYGKITLTEDGKAHIGEKLEQWHKLSHWYQVQCGLVPMLAEKEARTHVVTMSQEAVMGMLSYIEATQQPMPAPKQQTSSLTRVGPVNFDICKLDKKTLSMGDRGFSKPAYITCEKERFYVVLTPQPIAYHPKKHRMPVTGRLDRLWYRYEDRWIESCVRTDGRHYIPLAYLDMEEASQMGYLRIRARASVGVFVMPEGEAIITFYFQPPVHEQKPLNIGDSI